MVFGLLPAGAAIKTWDGSSSGNWSNGANWSGGTAPQTGDEVRFPATASNRTMTNNIANLRVIFMWFNEDGSSGYTLRGNPLTVGGNGGTGGIQSNHTNGVNTIDCDIIFTPSFTETFVMVFHANTTLDINGDIVLPGQFTRLRSEGFMELSGVISGSGDIHLTGSGVTTFNGTGNNTYSGTTFVESGTLRLNKQQFVLGQFVGRTAIPDDLQIGVGSGQDIVELLFNDQIANTANVRISRGLGGTDLGHLDLNGFSDTVGSLTFLGGQVIGGGTLGLNGDIQVSTSSLTASIDATLALGSGIRTCIVSNNSVNPDLDILRGITGTGGLVKAGPGALRFSGGSTANTYSGTTTVRAGVLELNKSAGTVAIPGSTLTIGDSSDNNNADIVRYLADNQISAGVDIFINRTGLLDLNDFDDVVGAISLVGGTIDTGAGTIQLSANLTAIGDMNGFTPDPALIQGKLNLGIVARTFTVNDDFGLGGIPTDLIVDATILGTVNWTKAGAGQMQLSGSNNFSGSVTVNAGALILDNAFALGTSAGGVTINNDASLQMAGGVSITGETMTLSSTASHPGALFGFGTSNFWGGPIVFQQASTIGVAQDSFLRLNGVISGNGMLQKEDEGQLILAGSSANTYVGLTFVEAGSIFCDKLGFSGAIPGNLRIGDGLGGANVDLVFYTLHQLSDQCEVEIATSGRLVVGADTIGSLRGAGTVDILNTGELITGNNNPSRVYDGIISGGGALTKRGTGAFTLNGNNTYTGLTTVEAGTLIVNGTQTGSAVTVEPGAALGGIGSLGDLSAQSGSLLSPGTSPGRLRSRNTAITNTASFAVELNGPVAGIDYDQLSVVGTLALSGSTLNPSLGFPPIAGQIFTIIDNNGTDPVTGTFAGLPNNTILNINQIPMRINYNGGTGNDVTLTVTNLPMVGGVAVIATGNGNTKVDPNECNTLFLQVRNVGSVTLSNLQTTLTSSTDGVIITKPFSAFPNLGAGAFGTNTTAFQFFTTSNFLCGQSIEFLLNITASNQAPFAIRYVLQSGTLTATQSFTNNTAVGIPGVGVVSSPISVSGITGGVAKVTVSLALSHPNLGELIVFLIPPSGSAIPLAAGLSGSLLGTNCTNGRVTFDDDAAQPITAGSSPYVGTFQPIADLSAADGRFGALVNGVWQLQVQDVVPNASAGAIACWSLAITPSSCTNGSGPCDICNGPFFGSITTNDLALAAVVPAESATFCGSTSGIVLTFTIPALTDIHMFTNSGGPACVTVTLDAPCANPSNALFSAAYLQPLLSSNRLGHSEQRIEQSPISYSFIVPSNVTFGVTVSGLSQATCSDYTLRVDGFDCPVPLDIGRSPNNRIVIRWPTHGSLFSPEWTTNLSSTNYVKLTNTPVVSGRDYVITNDIVAPRAFYRLRKQ